MLVLFQVAANEGGDSDGSGDRSRLEEAYDYCTRLATRHYENFPVGSRFAPLRLRRFLHAIYAFSRKADDFADEGDFPLNMRLQKLDGWEEKLRACYAGKATDPVFIALSDTIERIGLPRELFENLLTAFRQDVKKCRFGTFDELLDYCRNSAQPVGRLVLRVFGASTQKRDALSDEFCTALQLTNFWQDVSIDLKRGRVYFPLEDVERFGYTSEQLEQRSFDFVRLMQFQVERTKALFRSCSLLPGDVGGRLGKELALTWHGGMKILTKIERMGYDVLESGPRLTNADKLMVLTAAIFGQRR